MIGSVCSATQTGNFGLANFGYCNPCEVEEYNELQAVLFYILLAFVFRA
jgi:hypothetical protein